MRTVYSIAILSVFAGSMAAAQMPAITWGAAPPVFPAGAKFAVLQGDPSKAGIYTVRLDMPDGYTIAPHYHPTDENVTVVEGTFLIGMGDKVDLAHATALPTGGFATATANMHHFGVAKGHTIVQVHGMGPFALIYVNPADDPQRKAAGR